MPNAFGVEHGEEVSKSKAKSAAEMMDLAMNPGAKKAVPSGKKSAQVKSQLGMVGEQKGQKIPGVTKVNMRPLGKPAGVAPKSGFNKRVSSGIDATKDWVNKNPWKSAGAGAAATGIGTAGGTSYLNRR